MPNRKGAVEQLNANSSQERGDSKYWSLEKDHPNGVAMIAVEYALDPNFTNRHFINTGERVKLWQKLWLQPADETQRATFGKLSDLILFPEFVLMSTKFEDGEPRFAMDLNLSVTYRFEPDLSGYTFSPVSKLQSKTKRYDRFLSEQDAWHEMALWVVEKEQFVEKIKKEREERFQWIDLNGSTSLKAQLDRENKRCNCLKQYFTERLNKTLAAIEIMSIKFNDRDKMRLKKCPSVDIAVLLGAIRNAIPGISKAETVWISGTEAVRITFKEADFELFVKNDSSA